MTTIIVRHEQTGELCLGINEDFVSLLTDWLFDQEIEVYSCDAMHFLEAKEAGNGYRIDSDKSCGEFIASIELKLAP